MKKKNHSGLQFTFEWHSLLHDLRRNIWLIILAALITYMGLYVAERSAYSPSYTSSATLVVRAKSGSSGNYTSLSVSSDMAGVFATVFKDSSMKKLAAENIGMETFDGTVSTSVMSGVNLLTLSVKADDPELAYQLLKSILEVYPNISEAVFSNAVIDVMVAPQMPTVPTNLMPNTYRWLVISAAMLLMAAIITLLSLLRDTVKHEAAFQNSIDAALLGTVVHEKPHLSSKERLMRKKRSLLITDAYASLRFSEDYQKIATKLEYLQRHHGCKAFAVTSIAENEGKSTAASNLALALAGRGYRVMLIDLDVRKPSIYKIFECHSDTGPDFTDVLSRKKNAGDYKFLRYKKSSLFLALNRKYCDDASQWLGSDAVKECIASIRKKMDFVIIDTPPVSVSADAASIIAICDRAILVVRTDVVKVTEINDTIMTMSNVGANLAGCILNDVYPTFTFFGQIGQDESGRYKNRYDSYGRYGNYGGQTFSEEMLETDD